MSTNVWREVWELSYRRFSLSENSAGASRSNVCPKSICVDIAFSARSTMRRAR